MRAAVPPLSPELVLVSPDLRARALASLPELDPDALFAIVPRPVPPRRELRPQRALAVPFEARPRPHRAIEQPRAPVPVAVAAYVAEAVVLGALRGAAMIAVIAAAAFLLAR